MLVVDADLIAPERTRPLRRVEYEKLVELGAFEDERLELLYGTLVEMTPQGARHSECVRRLNEQFSRLLAGRAVVQVQAPFAASAESEPEPDLAIVPRGDYWRGHPSQALLVVEVADSSRAKDRSLKARLYAEAGVPEYWIVDLVGRTLEVMTEPAAGRYQSEQTLREGDVARPRALEDIALSVSDLLPPAER